MNPKEFKITVRNKLLQIESAVPSSGDDDQIMMRCQFCGDSRKDPNKKRLYIKLNMNDDNCPILYNCFNCGACGVLNPSVLRTLKIHDLNINSQLLSYNKSAINNFNKSMKITDNTFHFKVPKPYNTKSNMLKKKYIENRLGISIPAQELVDLKTVFSLSQFLKENDIDQITTSRQIATMLDNEYVGFLTAKNEFINFRDITNRNKYRYNKYNIFKNIDNTRKFYTIPTSIDLMSNDKIIINLAEGVFDILGIYYHLYNKNKDNIIYAAVCGSAYSIVIKYFIQLGIIGDNVIVNIYSDSDHNPYFYKELYNELSPWFGSINLYYNEKSKDFGVTKDEISVIHKKIR